MILFESNNFIRLKKRPLYNSISCLIEQEDFVCGNLTIVLFSDEELLQYNVKHLSHDTYTDVITFDYSCNNIISGDILISFERVLENAHFYNISILNELIRVVFHGVLHLCGYKDKSRSDIQLMKSKENHYLNNLFPY